MRMWCVRNGVPWEISENFSYWELVAHTIVFSQFENGGKVWDWERMSFINKD